MLRTLRVSVAGFGLVFAGLLAGQTGGDFSLTTPALTVSTSRVTVSVGVPAPALGGVISLFDGVIPAGSVRTAGEITQIPVTLTGAGSHEVRVIYRSASGEIAWRSSLQVIATPAFAGSFGAFHDLALPGSWTKLIAADFNGDGISDLAAADNSGAIHVFLSNGDGSVRAAGSVMLSGGPALALASADIDEDGHADLVVITSGATAVYFHGNGDGNFGCCAFGALLGQQSGCACDCGFRWRWSYRCGGRRCGRVYRYSARQRCGEVRACGADCCEWRDGAGAGCRRFQ